MMAAACADAKGRCRGSWLVLMGPRIRTAHSQVIRVHPDWGVPPSGHTSQRRMGGPVTAPGLRQGCPASRHADPGRSATAWPVLPAKRPACPAQPGSSAARNYAQPAHSRDHDLVFALMWFFAQGATDAQLRRSMKERTKRKVDQPAPRKTMPLDRPAPQGRGIGRCRQPDAASPTHPSSG